jgi:hypothetical protein
MPRPANKPIRASRSLSLRSETNPGFDRPLRGKPGRRGQRCLYRILYPLGIETSAIVRCIPGRTKAALRKRLSRHLTQHGISCSVAISAPGASCRVRVWKGLPHLQPAESRVAGAHQAGRYGPPGSSPAPLPGDEIRFSQRRRIIAQTHNGRRQAEKGTLPLQGLKHPVQAVQRQTPLVSTIYC